MRKYGIAWDDPEWFGDSFYVGYIHLSREEKMVVREGVPLRKACNIVGVSNSTGQRLLFRLGLWPKRARGRPRGANYAPDGRYSKEYYRERYQKNRDTLRAKQRDRYRRNRDRYNAARNAARRERRKAA